MNCGTLSGEAAATWFAGVSGIGVAAALYRLQWRSLFSDQDRQEVNALLVIARRCLAVGATNNNALTDPDELIQRVGDCVAKIGGTASVRLNSHVNMLEKTLLVYLQHMKGRNIAHENNLPIPNLAGIDDLLMRLSRQIEIVDRVSRSLFYGYHPSTSLWLRLERWRYRRDWNRR